MESVFVNPIYHCIEHEPVVLSPEQKPIEEKERKDKEELTQRTIILEKQLADSIKSMEDYKALTEERFNKLVALLKIQ
jgi:hypothetical protein